jgi:hypothetical protein
MPGYAHVEPESKYQDTGLIIIPDRFKGRKMSVGRVESWRPNFAHRCKDCGNIQQTGGHCRHCQRNRVYPFSTNIRSPFGLADITGLRVIYIEAALVPIAADQFRLPIDDIIAAVEDDVVLDDAAGSSGIKRCAKCGPAKEGSANAMILTNIEGVLKCPRCGWTP